MPLLNFESLDQVPEGLREYAKPVKEGESKVAVNVVASQKIDEFRDNNITLAKERDLLLKTLEPMKQVIGENVDEFSQQLQELRLVAQRVKDGELKETRQIEEALGKRTEELRKDYDSRLKSETSDKSAWKTKYADLEGQYQRSKIEFAIRDACGDPDLGVEPRAIADIVNAATPVFKIEGDGKIVPYEGTIPIYGGDGTTAMTPREWVKRLREQKPFFFKHSYGGGAGGENAGYNIAGQHLHGVPKEKLQAMLGKKGGASSLLDLANDAIHKAEAARAKR